MIEAFSDGCCRKEGKGGWGILIYIDNEILIAGSYADRVTNNMMELQGPIEILDRLTIFNEENKQVKITSDSSYFVDGFNQWMHGWEKKGWRKHPTKPDGGIANLDMWKKLFDMKFNRNIKASWVRGHSGHYENEICDAIANKCCGYRQQIFGMVPNTYQLSPMALDQFLQPNITEV